MDGATPAEDARTRDTSGAGADAKRNTTCDAIHLITEADARRLERGAKRSNCCPADTSRRWRGDTLRDLRVSVVAVGGDGHRPDGLAAAVRDPGARPGHGIIQAWLSRGSLAAWLRGRGLTVDRRGNRYVRTRSTIPDIAAAVARLVTQGEAHAGIVIDGAGLGSAIGGQQGQGRPRRPWPPRRRWRATPAQHNGANVLALGASLLSETEALAIVQTFLETPMTEPRYIRRLAKVRMLRRAARTGHPMTATDLQRLIQIVTEEVIAASGLGAPLSRCTCHSLNAECCPDRLRGVLDAGANRIGVHATGGASRDVAGVIDHTLLRPDATRQDIEQLCHEAIEFHFATVCVNPTWVALAAPLLRPHGVGVCAVIGFPLGATTPDVKQFEARRAIFDGATEIDMVINVGALKSGDLRTVERDIAAVADACQPCGVTSKVIIEAALLTDDEKISACALSKAAGADFVKTSTGFAKGGATVADVPSCAGWSARRWGSRPPGASATTRASRPWSRRARRASGPAPASASSASPGAKRPTRAAARDTDRQTRLPGRVLRVESHDPLADREVDEFGPAVQAELLHQVLAV